MKILNHSRVPTAAVEGPVGFAAACSRAPLMAILVLADDDRAHVIRGRAWKTSPEDYGLDFAAPSLVKLYIGPSRVYPKVTRLNARTPTVDLLNWEEELVFVLSHELRHVDQYWIPSLTHSDEEASERDAENHAIVVLTQYRMIRNGSY